MASEQKIGQMFGAEFAGTFLVMLAGPGLVVLSGETEPLTIAISSGVAMALAVGVIGAVANPMFSFALWLSRGITSKELLSDLAGQILGGIFGGLAIFGLNGLVRYGSGFNGWTPSTGTAPGVDLGITGGQFAELGIVLAAELLICTFLVIIVLSTLREGFGEATSAAFIGAGYGVATLFLFAISGAGLNPAKSLGAALFAQSDPSPLGQVWLFLVVPVVAAVAGMFIWLGLSESTIDDTVFDDSVIEDVSDRLLGDPDQ